MAKTSFAQCHCGKLITKVDINNSIIICEEGHRICFIDDEFWDISSNPNFYKKTNGLKINCEGCPECDILRKRYDMMFYKIDDNYGLTLLPLKQTCDRKCRNGILRYDAASISWLEYRLIRDEAEKELQKNSLPIQKEYERKAARFLRQYTLRRIKVHCKCK